MNNLYLCGTYALSLLDEGAIEHAALSEQQRFDAPLCTLSDISRRITERHLPTGDVQVFVPEGARHAQSSSICRFVRKQPFPAGSFHYLGEGIFAESHEKLLCTQRLVVAARPGHPPGNEILQCLLNAPELALSALLDQTGRQHADANPA